MWLFNIEGTRRLQIIVATRPIAGENDLHMLDYSRLEQQLTDALALPRRPVAIAARQHAPAKSL